MKEIGGEFENSGLGRDALKNIIAEKLRQLPDLTEGQMYLFRGESGEWRSDVEKPDPNGFFVQKRRREIGDASGGWFTDSLYDAFYYVSDKADPDKYATGRITYIVADVDIARKSYIANGSGTYDATQAAITHSRSLDSEFFFPADVRPEKQILCDLPASSVDAIGLAECQKIGAKLDQKFSLTRFRDQLKLSSVDGQKFSALQAK